MARRVMLPGPTPCRRPTARQTRRGLHGDTRKRGMALLRLKRMYAAAGLEKLGDELPDYLPMMLEFADLAPPGWGEEVLNEYRLPLEVLGRSLGERGSPYAHLLDAVRARLAT